MYTIISPSKTQDFEREVVLPSGVAGLFELAGVPEWNEQTKLLAGVMKKFKAKEMSELMKISPKLAELNFERFQKWDGNYGKSKNIYSSAIVAFLGDVYKGFDLNAWSITDYKYTHNHLGIISGFYGLISPLNYIQPYRLEMGTRLSFSVTEGEGVEGELKTYKNLYDFWSEILTERMATILKKEKVLINLASVEYSKVIDRKRLQKLMTISKTGQRVDKMQIVDIIFKVNKVSKKTGKREEKVIAIYAKRARGLMANWIIKTKPKTPKDLEKFAEDSWEFKEWQVVSSRERQILFVKYV